MEDDIDNNPDWTTSWFEKMKSYEEQLITWQQLQDYDAQAERAMVFHSDYKLGVYKSYYDDE